MSSINKQNCEAWFLDYFEGNLTPEQTEQLFHFLDVHPEFQEAFNQFEKITLQPVQFSLNTHSLLKQLPNQLANEISGTDYIAISYAENILTAKEKIKIDKLIEEDKDLKEAIESYSSLKLKPDMAIVFEEKNELKKPLIIPFVRFKQVYKYVASAAAVLLIAITVWNYLPEDNILPVSGLGVPSRRPVLASKQKVLKSEPLRNAANIEQTTKLNKIFSENKNNNVQTLNHSVKIENKEVDLVQKINDLDKKEQNTNNIVVQKENEAYIKPDELATNNVETLNNEEYITPDKLIFSKLLNSSSEEVLANNNSKKSKFWNVLDFASRKYSDITGRKIKIKKIDKEDNTIEFALITNKFEISHTASKK